MNIQQLEIMQKQMTDLQLEIKNLIGEDDKKAKEKLAELTQLQIKIIDAIEAYKNDKPVIN